MKNFLAFFILLLNFSFIAKAQLNSNYIGIGVGYNTISFKGDLNPEARHNIFNNYQHSFDVSIEKRFNSYIGLNANFLSGKLSQQEVGTTSGLNFESKVINFNLKAIIYFDNDLLLPKNLTFTPYIKAGVGMLMFDPYGDLKNSEGKSYHYWSGGEIMDLAENDENANSANEVSRDYNYETQFSSAQNTINIPVSIGITAKLNDNIGFRIETGYNFTTSDNIDNIVSGGNDNYAMSKIGIIYALNSNKNKSKVEEENLHEHFDFDFLHKHDNDSDGVADFHDHCQNTIRGIEVDGKGCPLDTDNDLVPDYLDKELNTNPGAHVTIDGVTMTDEHFLNNHLGKDSAVIMNRIKKLIEAPDLETLQAIDKQVEKEVEAGVKLVLPQKLKIADTNNDNIIQSGEMLHSIDAFLDGEFDITIETLYELIDHFFEQ